MNLAIKFNDYSAIEGRNEVSYYLQNRVYIAKIIKKLIKRA